MPVPDDVTKTVVMRRATAARPRRAPRLARRVCAAENVTRSRDVPGGTVGGRIAATRKPAARSAALAASARAALPMTSETIALAAGGRSSAAVNSRARVERPAHELLVRRDEVERAARGRDGAGRQARRVDEAASAIAHELRDAAARAQIAAVAADGFRQRAHLQRYGDGLAEREARAAAVADDAEAVRVVGHEPRIVLGGERRERRQRREVAFHAEHAVGERRGNGDARARSAASSSPQVRDVVVAKLEHARAAQARRPSAGSYG